MPSLNIKAPVVIMAKLIDQAFLSTETGSTYQGYNCNPETEND